MISHLKQPKQHGLLRLLLSPSTSLLVSPAVSSGGHSPRLRAGAPANVLHWGDLVALCPASAVPVPATATFCIQRHIESSVPSPTAATQEKGTSGKAGWWAKCHPASGIHWLQDFGQINAFHALR